VENACQIDGHNSDSMGADLERAVFGKTDRSSGMIGSRLKGLIRSPLEHDGLMRDGIS
jgi:hypothetical protein